MPTYEYACKDCGQHLEVVQSFSDDPLTSCSVCGGRLRKVFSAAGIIFKGSGYYVTDSRGKQAAADGAKGEKGEKGEKKPATDAGSGSGDSGSGKAKAEGSKSGASRPDSSAKSA